MFQPLGVYALGAGLLSPSLEHLRMNHSIHTRRCDMNLHGSYYSVHTKLGCKFMSMTLDRLTLCEKRKECEARDAIFIVCDRA